MSADNYVIIRKFQDGYRWADFVASDDPQPHPDTAFKSAVFSSWPGAYQNAEDELCVIEYGITVESPHTCPCCGGSDLSITSQRTDFPHHPGCSFDEEIITCRSCQEISASTRNDEIVLANLYNWECYHPDLKRLMELSVEWGYTPTTEEVHPRPEDEISKEMGEVWGRLNEEEQKWVREYCVWWDQKNSGIEQEVDMSENRGFKVVDKRGGKNQDPKPVCRVCGCKVEHTSSYNNPTMACIKYLRGRVAELEHGQES